MKLKLKIEKEFDVKFLHAQVGARYWEDAIVNGEEDETGELIPCRVGENWCPIIELETGLITNWKKGINANIHYKSCDDNTFTLVDENQEIVKAIEGYVIDIMSPEEDAYGDYVIMNIDENGQIRNWKCTPKDLACFNEED